MKDIRSSSTLDANQSKRSNRFFPTIVNPLSGPKDREQRTPTAPQMMKISVQAFGRATPKRSPRKATPTSIREMTEVIAATTTARKKRIAAMELTTGRRAPKLEKMKGIPWKIRPGPAPGLIPAAKTAGMMAMPASKANTRSKIAVPALDTTRFSSDFTYEP